MGRRSLCGTLASKRRTGFKEPHTTCSERSTVSGDLFACLAAPSIAARFPLSSIRSLGSPKRESSPACGSPLDGSGIGHPFVQQGRVFRTNDAHGLQLGHDADHMLRHVRAAWPIAQIFRENFFVPVRSDHPSLDCHARHRCLCHGARYDGCVRAPQSRFWKYSWMNPIHRRGGPSRAPSSPWRRWPRYGTWYAYQGWSPLARPGLCVAVFENDNVGGAPHRRPLDNAATEGRQRPSAQDVTLRVSPRTAPQRRCRRRKSRAGLRVGASCSPAEPTLRCAVLSQNPVFRFSHLDRRTRWAEPATRDDEELGRVHRVMRHVVSPSSSRKRPEHHRSLRSACRDSKCMTAEPCRFLPQGPVVARSRLHHRSRFRLKVANLAP